MVEREHEEPAASALRPTGGDQRQRQGIAAAGQRQRDRARACAQQALIKNLADRGLEVGACRRAVGRYVHFACRRTVAARDLMASGALG